MNKRDLFVVVADLDAENSVKTLLCHRQQSLGIRLDFNPTRSPNGDLLRCNDHDPGCFKKAVDLLTPPQITHRHAMIMFDWHGSGQESRPSEEIEGELELALQQSGWPQGAAAAIVIEPELEAWVWADSPHVPTALGWGGNPSELRGFLESKGLWPQGAAKPPDPKEAFICALKETGQPRMARLFSRLAEITGLAGCQDRAFRKFRRTLQGWFPLQPP